MPTARKNSSRNLEGAYLTNEHSLWLVVTHTETGLRLEDCYTNLQTFYTHEEAAPLKLRYVCHRGTNTPKTP